MDIGLLVNHSVVKENTENLSMAHYPNLSPFKRLYATVTNLITEVRPVSSLHRSIAKIDKICKFTREQNASFSTKAINSLTKL